MVCMHAQEALSYLQAAGAVSKLPDDVQWSIRALLMRRLPNVAALPRLPAPAQGTDPALPQLLGYLLQQMSKVRPDIHVNLYSLSIVFSYVKEFRSVSPL